MIRQIIFLAIVMLTVSPVLAQTVRLETYSPTYDWPERSRVGLTQDQPKYDSLDRIALRRQVYRYPYDNCQPRRYSQAEYQYIAATINSMPRSASTTAFRALSQTLNADQLRAIRVQYNRARTRDLIAKNRARYYD